MQKNKKQSSDDNTINSTYLGNEIFQKDEALDSISILSTKMMQKISIALSLSLHDEHPTHFKEQRNLDFLIIQLLDVLLKIKARLCEVSELIQEPLQTKQVIQELIFSIIKYKKTILVRQSQLGSLVYLLDHRHEADFQNKYLSKYGELDKFIINSTDAMKPINFFILEQAFKTEQQLLKEYLDLVDLLQLNIVDKKYATDINSLKTNINKLKIINSKIATIADIFPYACVMDTNDLFSFRRTDKRWQNLTEKYIKHQLYGDKEDVRVSFASLKKGLNIVNATMNIIHQTKSSWFKEEKDWKNIMSSTRKIINIMMCSKEACHEAQVLISDPSGELAKQIWNLPEQKIFKNFIAAVLPAIQFSEQFWIPRLFGNYLAKQGAVQIPELFILNISSYAKNLFEMRDYAQKIPMRINCPYPLQQKFAKEEKPKSLLFNIMESMRFTYETKVPHSVIYHIHGGGFISMSSFVHQTYTRIWANNLKVPIISVDYGKAPENPYPRGLHDCFEGYMWLLYCFRQVYEVEPNKVIFVGDSAGGNLAAALTNLLIKLKLRVPDGIVMVYPALSLNYHKYTPSLLTSLSDMILPHTFLKICLKFYLNKSADASSNCLISPIVAPPEILCKYPPTRIFVGSKDPFHDDCCRFTEKLNQCKQNTCHLMIFEEFPHGFLQFDIKTQPHELCRKATKQVEKALGELLNM